MAKVKQVRVSNPGGVADVPALVVKPAKMVAAFGVGAAIGTVALTPATNAIDDRLDSNVQRGAAKLASATAVLSLIAVVTNKNKKSTRKNAPLMAAASIGSVSSLITGGIDDLMGQSDDLDRVIEAQVIQSVANNAARVQKDAQQLSTETSASQQTDSMGRVLPANFFSTEPEKQMSGTSFYNQRPFGAYME